MISILCRYNPVILFPHNALEVWNEDNDVLTLDGKKCRIKYISAWDNRDNSYDEELNEKCIELYDMELCAVQSVWIARIGYCSPVWHLAELVLK